MAHLHQSKSVYLEQHLTSERDRSKCPSPESQFGKATGMASLKDPKCVHKGIAISVEEI